MYACIYIYFSYIFGHLDDQIYKFSINHSIAITFSSRWRKRQDREVGEARDRQGFFEQPLWAIGRKVNQGEITILSIFFSIDIC